MQFLPKPGHRQHDTTYCTAAQYTAPTYRARTVESGAAAGAGAAAAPTGPLQTRLHRPERPPGALPPTHVLPRALPTPPCQARGGRQGSHVPRRVAQGAGPNRI